MSSCIENSTPLVNLSQICQTDISFGSDCTAKYLPLEKVYFHILEKIHEAFFDLRNLDCSFDNGKSGDIQRDSIIRRACKRPWSSDHAHVPLDDNHVDLPAKVAKEEAGLQKPVNTTTGHVSLASVSINTPPNIDPRPTCSVSTSPSITLTLPPTENNVSPRKPSPPLIYTESSPFTSPSTSDQGGRAMTSPLVDNRAAPLVDGIIGVLCPTSNNSNLSKPDNPTPFDLSPFSPFLASSLSD
ncbi:uncharacterized protein LOC134819242 [Bolinopsis microptera]|uniref:uncharacterized protein LOC134819242 n=1 Tax=Bolinopsis microptera TaxID=2820187 RepID=UPI003078FD3A